MEERKDEKKGNRKREERLKRRTREERKIKEEEERGTEKREKEKRASDRERGEEDRSCTPASFENVILIRWAGAVQGRLGNAEEEIRGYSSASGAPRAN